MLLDNREHVGTAYENVDTWLLSFATTCIERSASSTASDRTSRRLDIECIVIWMPRGVVKLRGFELSRTSHESGG